MLHTERYIPSATYRARRWCFEMLTTIQKVDVAVLNCTDMAKLTSEVIMVRSLSCLSFTTSYAAVVDVIGAE